MAVGSIPGRASLVKLPSSTCSQGFNRLFSFNICILSSSSELGASEIKAMFTCNIDPKGDLIEWTQSKWAKEGEASFSPIRVTEFCAKPFSNDMVCVFIGNRIDNIFKIFRQHQLIPHTLGDHPRSRYICRRNQYM